MLHAMDEEHFVVLDAIWGWHYLVKCWRLLFDSKRNYLFLFDYADVDIDFEIENIWLLP